MFNRSVGASSRGSWQSSAKGSKPRYGYAVLVATSDLAALLHIAVS
jgi:hypothetical protein